MASSTRNWSEYRRCSSGSSTTGSHAKYTLPQKILSIETLIEDVKNFLCDNPYAIELELVDGGTSIMNMLIDIYNSECLDKAAPDGPSSSADLSLQTQHISISDLIECRKHKIFTSGDINGVNEDIRMVSIDYFNENFSQYIPHSLKVQMDLQIKCQHLFDKCDQFFNIYIYL